MKNRTIVSVTPPLGGPDRRDLDRLVHRINKGKDLFLGVRFSFRGSMVVLSPVEPDKAGAYKPKGRSRVGTGRP